MSVPSGLPQTPFRPHVLIVSNDPDLTAFLSEGLTFGGFWTSAVASAIQTLEVFRVRSFDLVLVDGSLAGLGAPELIRRLRGRSDRAAGAPRTDVPILAIAGDSDPSSAERLAAADAVLSPPLDLEDLVPTLHRTVTTWRAAHPDRPPADVLAQQRPPGSGSLG
jgi:CheY-like chemotaxis protein